MNISPSSEYRTCFRSWSELQRDPIELRRVVDQLPLSGEFRQQVTLLEGQALRPFGLLLGAARGEERLEQPLVGGDRLQFGFDALQAVVAGLGQGAAQGVEQFFRPVHLPQHDRQAEIAGRVTRSLQSGFVDRLRLFQVAGGDELLGEKVLQDVVAGIFLGKLLQPAD
jgi:hypothetical protein